MQEEKLESCPLCESDGCYRQHIAGNLYTFICFNCGFTTSTVLKKGSKTIEELEGHSPELYKEMQKVDDKDRVWFPATINLPEKGIVFMDGTGKEDWTWASAQAVPILEEERERFPKGQTHKIDMTSLKAHGQGGFMDALMSIRFFEVEEE